MSFLGGLIKTVVNVAVIPVEIVKDVVTLGGALENEEEPYTVQRAKKALKALDKAADDAEKGDII